MQSKRNLRRADEYGVMIGDTVMDAYSDRIGVVSDRSHGTDAYGVTRPAATVNYGAAGIETVSLETLYHLGR